MRVRPPFDCVDTLAQALPSSELSLVVDLDLVVSSIPIVPYDLSVAPNTPSSSQL